MLGTNMITDTCAKRDRSAPDLSNMITVPEPNPKLIDSAINLASGRRDTTPLQTRPFKMDVIDGNPHRGQASAEYKANSLAAALAAVLNQAERQTSHHNELLNVH